MRRQLIGIFALLLLLSLLPFAVSSQGPVVVKRISASGTPTPTPVAFVQSKLGNTSITFDSSLTAGHLIVLALFPRGSATPSVSTVTSAVGNTYTAVDTVVNAFGLNEGVQIWYAENSNSGTEIVTPVLGGGASNVYIYGLEYSGALTSGALGSHTTGTGSPTLSVTAVQSGNLLFGAAVNGSGAFTAGSGYTIINSAVNFFEAAEYKNATGSGAVNVDFGGGDSSSEIAAAVFKN